MPLAKPFAQGLELLIEQSFEAREVVVAKSRRGDFLAHLWVNDEGRNPSDETMTKPD